MKIYGKAALNAYRYFDATFATVSRMNIAIKKPKIIGRPTCKVTSPETNNPTSVQIPAREPQNVFEPISLLNICYLLYWI